MSLTHLLDTSVYCQPIKKKPLPQVEKYWRAIGDQSVCISVICEAELLQGLEAKNSRKLWKAYDSILKNRLVIFPIDTKTAETYAKLASTMNAKGKPRPALDLFIAATAKTHGLIVATCNYSDFSCIEGVAIENWSK
ncbi:MAG: type II toxin-antitoxin system VapC family toxin [Candidatus Brocadiaceae bacterium]|nr:type II toxin-antitoxin system VapC family toxin [Candidatus Brocadiaceae bacterium]